MNLDFNRLITPLIIGTILFFTCSHVNAKTPDGNIRRHVISGYLKDHSNGEALIGANIYIKEMNTGTASNSYGFYSITVPDSQGSIVFSCIGYQSKEIKIRIDKDQTINIELTPSSAELSEVVVTSVKPGDEASRPQMSVQKLQMNEIKRIPALMGEVDLIKVVQMLPGVQSTSEGSSGFSVRGGGIDQNLILLDEAIVYNASHLLGFFSVFNNDAIKDVNLYKGDIPASVGGRLSSLLDIRMREGNQKELEGSGGIGTISSRLTLEAPIVKDRTSFIISGRRTYLDLFLPLSNDEKVKDNTLYFYDLNLKINHQLNNNNRLFISGYLGKDQFKNDLSKLGFGNKTFTLRWNHLFSNKLFANFSIVKSNYNYELGTSEKEANGFEWTSNMDDLSFKTDFSHFITPKITLKYGIQSIYHQFAPGDAVGTGKSSSFNQFRQNKQYTFEHAAYTSAEQQISSNITLKYGLRFSLFQNMGKSTRYIYDQNHEVTDSIHYASGKIYHTASGLEPRLGLTWLINPLTSIKSSYSRTMQYVHLAQNSTSGTPLDVWFPTSPNVKPQIADQYAVGIVREYPKQKLEASVEVYYKNMENAIDFKDHAQLLLNKHMEGELRFGKAYSYGTEFLLRFNEKKLNGWISYTWSRTWRKIDEINDGRRYRAPYDKPNNISVVMSYNISKRVDFSYNWVYATGAPVTFPTGRYEYGGKIIPEYSDRNSYRMPDYHRLDLSLNVKSKENPKHKWRGEWNFSVYNAYGRKNAWAINFVQDKDDPTQTYAEKTYLFSFIPSVTYNFKF
ncbi:MAG: TonB-dependent receptor [Bacteroidota bacterium]|nr:TonB-dependent receptor [Bacteroidota bacterium]MDP4206575.1 TonB-dependent receptor [Bacteroidota bacterium]